MLWAITTLAGHETAVEVVRRVTVNVNVFWLAE
jgi:hypothetical protein